MGVGEPNATECSARALGNDAKERTRCSDAQMTRYGRRALHKTAQGERCDGDTLTRRCEPSWTSGFAQARHGWAAMTSECRRSEGMHASLWSDEKGVACQDVCRKAQDCGLATDWWIPMQVQVQMKAKQARD